MSPVSESCTVACGAHIDLVPGMALSAARRFIDSWRVDHRHYDGPAADPTAKPLGFNLQQIQAVASTEFDGESENDE